MPCRTTTLQCFALLALAAGGLWLPTGTASSQPSTSASDAERDKRMEAMHQQHVLNSAGQAKKDKDRDARTDRLSRSVCIGCGGGVVPFNPSGGAAKKEPRRAQAAKPRRIDPARAGGGSDD